MAKKPSDNAIHVVHFHLGHGWIPQPGKQKRLKDKEMK